MMVRRNAGQAPNFRGSYFINRETFDLAKEWEFKVSYDFKRFVMLVPNGVNVTLETMLETIYRTKGYEAHKIVYQRELPSHIHVRYVNEEHAYLATLEFQNVSGVNSIKVSNLLSQIYTSEHSARRFPAWTLAIVDIEGTAQHVNPLSSEIVNSLLRRFGEPRIFTYHSGASTVNHVQVLFSSMAEALGASIANGRWCQGDILESPRFRYRVRIVGSDKECEVLNINSDLRHEAFELDYFIGSDLSDLSGAINPTRQSLPEIGYRNTQRQNHLPRSARHHNGTRRSTVYTRTKPAPNKRTE